MSVSNPFINNCKLIRSFFDSALLLIICVLLFCCACADIFLIYTLNSPVTILVPLIAELFPSALCLQYICEPAAEKTSPV